MITLFLTGVVAMIMLRTLHNNVLREIVPCDCGARRQSLAIEINSECYGACARAVNTAYIYRAYRLDTDTTSISGKEQFQQYITAAVPSAATMPNDSRSSIPSHAMHNASVFNIILGECERCLRPLALARCSSLIVMLQQSANAEGQDFTINIACPITLLITFGESSAVAAVSYNSICDVISANEEATVALLVYHAATHTATQHMLEIRLNISEHCSMDAVVQQLLETACIHCTTIDDAVQLGHLNTRHAAHN
eukprot:14132-Heterococcus_DN1.PRE.7